jgi:predicted small lipoprotein YifL
MKGLTAILLLIVALTSLTACGRRGDPEPPALQQPL